MLKGFKPKGNLNETMEGRVVWVLILVCLVQFSYPISEGNHPLPLLIYQFFYTGLIVAGILVARENTAYMRVLIFLGVLWIVFGCMPSISRLYGRFCWAMG